MISQRERRTHPRLYAHRNWFLQIHAVFVNTTTSASLNTEQEGEEETNETYIIDKHYKKKRRKRNIVNEHEKKVKEA